MLRDSGGIKRIINKGKVHAGYGIYHHGFLL